MVTLEFLDCVARFQTLIAGALVFLGVIATLYFNARLARYERHKSLKLEQLAIRTALIEELKIMRIGLVDGVEKFENHEGRGGAAFSKYTVSDVYNTLIPRIGLLTPFQVEKVLFAYMSAIQFRENLELYSGAEVQEHHVYVPSEEFDSIVRTLNDYLIPHVDKAISSLS